MCYVFISSNQSENTLFFNASHWHLLLHHFKFVVKCFLRYGHFTSSLEVLKDSCWKYIQNSAVSDGSNVIRFYYLYAVAVLWHTHHFWAYKFFAAILFITIIL